jgi:hypothetical protein
MALSLPQIEQRLRAVTQSSEAFVYIAMLNLMLKRLD